MLLTLLMHLSGTVGHLHNSAHHKKAQGRGNTHVNHAVFEGGCMQPQVSLHANG